MNVILCDKRDFVDVIKDLRWEIAQHVLGGSNVKLKLSRILWGLPGYEIPSESPISCL